MRFYVALILSVKKIQLERIRSTKCAFWFGHRNSMAGHWGWYPQLPYFGPKPHYRPPATPQGRFLWPYVAFEGAQGVAALQIRAYLALMVLLEVTLRVFGFSSFYVYLR